MGPAPARALAPGLALQVAQPAWCSAAARHRVRRRRTVRRAARVPGREIGVVIREARLGPAWARVTAVLPVPQEQLLVVLRDLRVLEQQARVAVRHHAFGRPVVAAERDPRTVDDHRLCVCVRHEPDALARQAAREQQVELFLAHQVAADDAHVNVHGRALDHGVDEFEELGEVVALRAADVDVLQLQIQLLLCGLHEVRDWPDEVVGREQRRDRHVAVEHQRCLRLPRRKRGALLDIGHEQIGRAREGRSLALGRRLVVPAQVLLKRLREPTVLDDNVVVAVVVAVVVVGQLAGALDCIVRRLIRGLPIAARQPEPARVGDRDLDVVRARERGVLAECDACVCEAILERALQALEQRWLFFVVCFRTTASDLLGRGMDGDRELGRVALQHAGAQRPVDMRAISRRRCRNTTSRHRRRKTQPACWLDRSRRRAHHRASRRIHQPLRNFCLHPR